MANAVTITWDDETKQAYCDEVVSLCGESQVTVSPSITGPGIIVFHKDEWNRDISAFEYPKTAAGYPQSPELDNHILCWATLNNGVGTLQLNAKRLVDYLTERNSPGVVVPVDFDLFDTSTGGNHGLIGRGSMRIMVTRAYDVSDAQALTIFKGDPFDRLEFSKKDVSSGLYGQQPLLVTTVTKNLQTNQEFKKESVLFERKSSSAINVRTPCGAVCAFSDDIDIPFLDIVGRNSAEVIYSKKLVRVGTEDIHEWTDLTEAYLKELYDANKRTGYYKVSEDGIVGTTTLGGSILKEEQVLKPLNASSAIPNYFAYSYMIAPHFPMMVNKSYKIVKTETTTEGVTVEHYSLELDNSDLHDYRLQVNCVEWVSSLINRKTIGAHSISANPELMMYATVDGEAARVYFTVARLPYTNGADGLNGRDGSYVQSATAYVDEVCTSAVAMATCKVAFSMANTSGSMPSTVYVEYPVFGKVGPQGPSGPQGPAGCSGCGVPISGGELHDALVWNGSTAVWDKYNYGWLEGLPKINDKTVEGSHEGDYYHLVDKVISKNEAYNSIRLANYYASTSAAGVPIPCSCPSSNVGDYSLAGGGYYYDGFSSPTPNTFASGNYSLAFGVGARAEGDGSIVFGYNVRATSTAQYAFVWNGACSQYAVGVGEEQREGTFNINPRGGLGGFYIGGESMQSILSSCGGGIQKIVVGSSEYTGNSVDISGEFNAKIPFPASGASSGKMLMSDGSTGVYWGTASGGGIDKIILNGSSYVGSEVTLPTLAEYIKVGSSGCSAVRHASTFTHDGSSYYGFDISSVLGEKMPIACNGDGNSGDVLVSLGNGYAYWESPVWATGIYLNGSSCLPCASSGNIIYLPNTTEYLTWNVCATATGTSGYEIQASSWKTSTVACAPMHYGFDISEMVSSLAKKSDFSLSGGSITSSYLTPLFSSSNDALVHMIQYGYNASSTLTSSPYDAIEGSVNRIGTLECDVTVNVPIPSDNNTAEFMLRLATAPIVSPATEVFKTSFTASTSVEISNYYLEGDELEAPTSGLNQYIQMVTVIPNGYNEETQKNVYEIMVTTRQMKESV